MLACGMTDAEVIARAQAGEKASFEVLYNLHKRRVYSLCLRMTRDCSDAEDMTQEAFLQLYRKIGSFRGESAFATWLHRLTVNIVLMAFRKKGLPEVSLEGSQDAQYEESAPREFGAQDPVLHGSLDRITLDKAIAELAPGYRMIFMLHDVQGYEHNEIAEILSCALGTSKSQLHKARLKLRSLLRIIPEANATELSRVA
jgi:RNA polymerase sigma-70 factor (ECF subfamily)